MKWSNAAVHNCTLSARSKNAAARQQNPRELTTWCSCYIILPNISYLPWTTSSSAPYRLELLNSYLMFRVSLSEKAKAKTVAKISERSKWYYDGQTGVTCVSDSTVSAVDWGSPESAHQRVFTTFRQSSIPRRRSWETARRNGRRSWRSRNKVSWALCLYLATEIKQGVHLHFRGCSKKPHVGYCQKKGVINQTTSITRS